jgi:hypothetical protein
MCSAAAVAFLAGCRSHDDGAEKPKNPLEWHWSIDKARLDYSIEQYLPDYELERVRANSFYTPINIRTKPDGKVIFSLKGGHEDIVFARWKNILYIADFSPIASGCAVVAVELTTGQQLWRSVLEGIDTTLPYSEYTNRVNIETDGHIVIVRGNESHGRYIEHLDCRNGKTLVNKNLAADFKSLHGG